MCHPTQDTSEAGRADTRSWMCMSELSLEFKASSVEEVIDPLLREQLRDQSQRPG